MVICSERAHIHPQTQLQLFLFFFYFRKFALLVEVPRGIAAYRFCHKTLDGAVWSDIMTSLFPRCRVLQKPSTFPSSTCIDLLQGDLMHVIYRSYWIYVTCAAAIFLKCLKQHVCGYSGSSKSRYLLCRRSSNEADLFCQDQTHEHCHLQNSNYRVSLYKSVYIIKLKTLDDDYFLFECFI